MPPHKPDWPKLDSLSDKEIAEQIAANPDAAPLQHERHRMHTPADYQKLLDVALATFAADYTVRYTEPMLHDGAIWLTNFTIKCMIIPKPLTASCLFICLHEVGHAVLLAEGIQDHLNDLGQGEFCASLWAKGYMAAHNIPVPPAIWATALANAQTH